MAVKFKNIRYGGWANYCNSDGKPSITISKRLVQTFEDATYIASHEFAHIVADVKYGYLSRIHRRGFKPHGKEFKRIHKRLLKLARTY